MELQWNKFDFWNATVKNVNNKQMENAVDSGLFSKIQSNRKQQFQTFESTMHSLFLLRWNILSFVSMESLEFVHEILRWCISNVIWWVSEKKTFQILDIWTKPSEVNVITWYSNIEFLFLLFCFTESFRWPWECSNAKRKEKIFDTPKKNEFNQSRRI